MKKTALILISALGAAQSFAFDLPKQLIRSYECEQCNQLSHESLNHSWSISSNPLSSRISNRQKSYHYRKQVTSAQLRAGVALSTDAPGAVIRITPLQKQSMPSLQLITSTKKQFSVKEASTLYKEDTQTFFQLKPEIGSGNFILQSNESKAVGTFLINVFDKFSASPLTIETDSVHYQYGDKITATISLGKYDLCETDDINANLVGPQKQKIPLEFTETKANIFQATATLSSEINDNGENWYVEADVVCGLSDELFSRTGHAAFSYSIPSATLLDIKKVASTPLTFETHVDIATASRYALQTVLFRKNEQGEAIPIETSQKAQWLEPGTQQMQFTFDNVGQLKDDSLFLGYIRLIDYGQLKPVYQFNELIGASQFTE